MEQYVIEVRELIRNWVDMWNTFNALEGDDRRLHFRVVKGKHYVQIKLAVRGSSSSRLSRLSSTKIDIRTSRITTYLTGFSILINVEDTTLTKVVLDEGKLRIYFYQWLHLLKDKHIFMKNGRNHGNYKVVYVMAHELEDIKQLLEIQKGALEI